MKKKYLLLFLLLLLVPFLYKGKRENKVKISEIEIILPSEIKCYDSTCVTKDKSVKIFREDGKIRIEANKSKITLTIPVKYIGIKVDGKIYYRKIKDGDNLRLLKEFVIIGNGKYEISLRNGLAGKYPVLFFKDGRAFINVTFDGNGSLSIRKGL